MVWSDTGHGVPWKYRNMEIRTWLLRPAMVEDWIMDDYSFRTGACSILSQWRRCDWKCQPNSGNHSMHCFGSIYFTNGTRIKEEILWWRNAQIEYDAGRNSPGRNIIIITKVVEILNFKCQEEIFDELYYYRYRLWLHRFILFISWNRKDMLSVLKKKQRNADRLLRNVRNM